MSTRVGDVWQSAGTCVKAGREDIIIVKGNYQNLSTIIRNAVEMPAFKRIWPGKVVPHVVFQTRTERNVCRGLKITGFGHLVTVK